MELYPSISMMKKSKNKKKNVREPVAKKSKTILKRKQTRKDKRQAKKAAQREYVTKKFRKTKLADHEDEEIPSDVEDLGGGITKAKQEAKKPGQNDHEKVKKQMKELTRQQKKQRKRQLVLANEAEQHNIKQLEKNLGLKRRKSKNMPKSFMEDGLDFLLDACDSSKLANWNDEDLEDEEDSKVDHKAEANLLSDDDSVLDGLFSDDNEEDDSSPDQSDCVSDDEEAPLHDQNEELCSSEENENVEDFKEDIYGRKRDVRGNIVKSSEPDTSSDSQSVGKYVPPAMRNKANLGVTEEKKKALERLSKHLKGLLNRSFYR